MMVLSGMSTPEQMADNLSFMRDFRPLSKEESATVDEVRRAFDAIDRIACTSCHYCTGGCPVHMHIPDIFRTVGNVTADMAVTCLAKGVEGRAA